MGFFGDLLDTFTEKDRWMRRAAGISTLRLICHEDTWRALKNLPADSLEHPSHTQRIGVGLAPERITSGESGLQEIVLSGPDVVRVIKVTAYNKKSTNLEWRAIAQRAYIGFGSVLQTVGPHHTPDTEIPPVILDDRPPAATA